MFQMHIVGYSRLRALCAPTIGVAAIAVVLGFQTAAAAQTQPARTVVDWRATEYAFTAPDTLPAGLVTIR
jgi:hypothetical protein